MNENIASNLLLSANTQTHSPPIYDCKQWREKILKKEGFDMVFYDYAN